MFFYFNFYPISMIGYIGVYLANGEKQTNSRLKKGLMDQVMTAHESIMVRALYSPPKTFDILLYKIYSRLLELIHSTPQRSIFDENLAWIRWICLIEFSGRFTMSLRILHLLLLFFFLFLFSIWIQ